jgi:hypothetical protein
MTRTLVITALQGLALIIVLTAFLYLQTKVELLEQERPRLVAMGCEGTPGYRLYADEQDHFPKCLIIKANK